MHLPGVEYPHFFFRGSKRYEILVCDAANANIKHLLLYTIVRQEKNKNRIIPNPHTDFLECRTFFGGTFSVWYKSGGSKTMCRLIVPQCLLICIFEGMAACKANLVGPPLQLNSWKKTRIYSTLSLTACFRVMSPKLNGRFKIYAQMSQGWLNSQ